MKTCVLLLGLLLAADALLAGHATGSPGSGLAVLCLLVLYPLLVRTLPKWGRGTRWVLLFAALAAGFGLDHFIGRPFHWFTAVAAVAAAGHFAGYAGAVDVLARIRDPRQVPARLGRPGCFNTAFAASVLLAYLCQTDAGGLHTRAGLIAGFVVMAAGFMSWELGRSVRGRSAELGMPVAAGARLLRWLLASAAVLAAFLVFAQVLPLTADQAARATPWRVTGDSLEFPDFPDLDDARFTDPARSPVTADTSPGTFGGAFDEGQSVEGISGGFSRDVAGGDPESVSRLQEFAGGEATRSQGGNPLVADNASGMAPGADPAVQGASPDAVPRTWEARSSTSAFWDVPPGLVWPVLLLAVLAGLAFACVLLFLRASPGADHKEDGEASRRKSLREGAFVPRYLRDFLARAAELGFEKERGDTLRDFLRQLRRAGLSHEGFRELRDYHYGVQFEGARRSDARERRFRREARKWLG